MIRRTARLRREFIYRKSLEGKERELYEKKRTIRQCLEEGKAIPTELRQQEASLRNDLSLEVGPCRATRVHFQFRLNVNVSRRRVAEIHSLKLFPPV